MIRRFRKRISRVFSPVERVERRRVGYFMGPVYLHRAECGELVEEADVFCRGCGRRLIHTEEERPLTTREAVEEMTKNLVEL